MTPATQTAEHITDQVGTNGATTIEQPERTDLHEPTALDSRPGSGDSAPSGPKPSDERLRAALDDIRDELRGCMQCGTCSASCPNNQAMDLTPRQMWRLLLHGYEDEVMDSRTFYYCSSCYSCTLRCPRGLKLTNVMASLKRAAALRGGPGQRDYGAFYQTFAENIRRLGRVSETDLMARYFLALRDPLMPFKFLPLGMRMMIKGKAGLHASPQRGRLEKLFEKVREIEQR